MEKALEVLVSEVSSEQKKHVIFLKEDVLFADGVYTFEPHSSAEISVVFVGHHGSHELMPDRNPPEPIIIDCDDVEDVIDEE